MVQGAVEDVWLLRATPALVEKLATMASDLRDVALLAPHPRPAGDADDDERNSRCSPGGCGDGCGGSRMPSSSARPAARPAPGAHLAAVPGPTGDIMNRFVEGLGLTWNP